MGQATILHPDGKSFIEWIGLDVATNEGANNVNSGATAIVSEGYSHAVDQHIVWADFGSLVDVQVASRTAVRIHSIAPSAHKVVITFIW